MEPIVFMNRKFIMDIKRLIMTSAVTLCALLAVSAQAEQFNDVCSKIPGHWDGIYTLKNPADCKRVNGCTHLVSADLSFLGGHDYHVVLTPAVGHGGEFNLKCENGVITSPVNPGNKTTVSCNATNHCFVVYDDPQLTAEMKKG